MFNFLKSTPTADSLKHKTHNILHVFNQAQADLEEVVAEQIALIAAKKDEVIEAEKVVKSLQEEVKDIDQDINYTQKMIAKIANFLK